MIGNSRAAVGLHERVGFRTGEVALLPTDPAQQEAKRATVIRVGVIASERPVGVRGLCEEQTRAIRTSSPPLMRLRGPMRLGRRRACGRPPAPRPAPQSAAPSVPQGTSAAAAPGVRPSSASRRMQRLGVSKAARSRHAAYRSSRNAACGRAGSGSPAQFVLDCPADPRR
jgi:hypothetical protein